MDIMKIPDLTRIMLKKIRNFMGEGDDYSTVSSFSNEYLANQSLKLDMPSFRTLLPFETMREDGFFLNKSSIGFGLMLMPLASADESLVKSLSELIKNKLPDNVDVHFMLYKHHYLSGMLSKSYLPLLEKGGIYAELAKLSAKYHINAIKNGYKNGRNVPALLSDYCCYLFVSAKDKRIDENELLLLREDWEAELKVSGIPSQRLNQSLFLSFMRSITSPNLNEIEWPEIDIKDGYLSDSITNSSTIYQFDERKITVEIDDESGCAVQTQIVNLEITDYPNSEFALWQTPDLFANLLRPEYGIQCPFLISFVIRGTQQEKIKSIAKSRASSLNSNTNSVQAFINPSMIEEAKEWNFVHQEASKDNLKLLPTFYNVMLFTSEVKEREHVAKAIASFRQMGFGIQRAKCKQWIRYLASLPFMLTSGYFDSLSYLGAIKSLTHYNVANLLPIVADFKGCSEGILLPTYRHQAFFYNPFDDKRLPITNYNRLTIASPGAGKSYFQMALILDGLSRGHKIFVIDLGESYKHLCQVVGGTYIDAASISLNPFTLFDFEGITEINGKSVHDHVQIRDLLAIMASPSAPLSEIQRTWLLDAVIQTWHSYQHDASMDKVLKTLKNMSKHDDIKCDQRLTDLIVLLSRYGSHGIYGHMFNAKTPLFNNSDFVVFEMGGLKENPELLTIVMFVMIVVIQGQFYQTDRRTYKQCIIDEAWQFLAKGSNPTTAQFIEQGFRTARKHSGGFSVITQNLKDTAQTIQGQAIESSSDTKIIMRQGAFKDFVEEHPKRFNELQKYMIESFGEAKKQGFSNLMMEFGGVSTFHRYFSDPFSRILFSSSGDEFGAIEALVEKGHNLVDAIQTIAKQVFGDEL